jgi:hypothetical protein
MLTTLITNYLLLIIYSLNTSFASDINKLVVKGSHHHVCSSNGFCSNIGDFSIANDPFTIDANRKSDVKIWFKTPVACDSKDLVESFAFLSTYGGVSVNESMIPDIRRTKV